MTGVVVGVRHPAGSSGAVRWASAAAELRGLSLTLVHVWDEPLDLAVDLDPESLPDLVGRATSCAVHGSAVAALLSREPELLVLGRYQRAGRLTHIARQCLHHAACPLVVVPDTERLLTGRVVVGVCGTEASRVALRWASREARLRHAELLVCYAWQIRPGSAGDVLRPARAVPVQQAAAHRRLSRWVVQVLGPRQVEVQLTHGGPLDGLLEASADADLVVVGSSVHAGRGRLLHSAVSDDLCGLAACPVAVIPRGDTDVAAPRWDRDDS